MAHILKDEYAKIVDAKLRKELVLKFAFNTRFEGVPTARSSEDSCS